MKYEAPEAEVIRFDEDYFMTFSGTFDCIPYDKTNPTNCENYTDQSTGANCKGFQKGSYCGNYAYTGFTCYGYNGKSGSVNGAWYGDNAPSCSIF